MKIKNLLSLFLVAALLGLTTAVLYQANNPSGAPEPENQQLVDIITNQESDIDALEQNIEELRASFDAELEKQTQGLSTISSLNDALQGARYFAGFSERTGAGILLTLSDNVLGAEQAKQDNPDTYRPEDYIIHDKNLLYIVNDIKAANPDGVSINGQRIVSNTNIRCVGTVILVNDRRLAPPYKISILGDKAAITEAIFNSAEVEYLVSSGFALTYEDKDEMILPAYKGNLNLQYSSLYVEAPEEPETPEEPSEEPQEDTTETSPAAPAPDQPSDTEESEPASDEEADAPEGADPNPEDPQDDPDPEAPMEPPADPVEEPVTEDPVTEEPAEEPTASEQPPADSETEEEDEDDE